MILSSVTENEIINETQKTEKKPKLTTNYFDVREEEAVKAYLIAETKQEKEREIRLSYNRRLKNLRNDFQRDENERLENLKTSLRKTFGGLKIDVDKFIDESAYGTTDEVIRQYPYWLIKEKDDNLPF
jgi:uncharacterized membrane-anchored protein YjiN (DUF445 family)